MYFKIKKFNNILIIKNIDEIKKIENYLKIQNILILGYYIQNIFFFKKDFQIMHIEKKNIIDNLKKRILSFYIKKLNIIKNIKKIMFKFILLLKKKNGNY
jgi:hypothetical protein